MKFHRLAHLKYQPIVKVGERILAGETKIGRVGSTGRSTGSHVHHDGTLAKPRSWYQYKSRPLSEYFDTESYAHLVLPYKNRFFTNRHGRNGHRGVDINVAPDDEGLPVYSPVNGTVAFVERPISVYRLVSGIRTLFQPTWGQGFGNFFWIAEDELLAGGVPLKAGLNDQQIASLRSLAEKPLAQWSGDDKKNWAWATNNGSMPKQ